MASRGPCVPVTVGGCWKNLAWCVCGQLLSCVQVFAAPWVAACQAPLSMEFSRQEYWNGLPFPPPGDLPDPRFKPTSPASPELAARLFSMLNDGFTRNSSDLL